jgi:hypothetical protein
MQPASPRPLWVAELYCRRGRVDTWPNPVMASWSSTDSQILLLKTLRRLSDGSLIGKTPFGDFWLIEPKGR